MELIIGRSLVRVQPGPLGRGSKRGRFGATPAAIRSGGQHNGQHELAAAPGEWGKVSSSRYRRQWPTLPSIPTADLSSLTSSFDSARRDPWPGGRKPTAEQLERAAQKGEWDRPAGAKLINREALTHFEAA